MEDNNQTETLHEILKYPRGATVFAAVCSIIFIITGLLGNLLTILALCRSVKLRNATTAFVISLCTADFLFCAINLPLTASRYIHQAWTLGETMCSLFPFFFYGNVGASLLSMTLITINRFILINHYNLYDKIYKKRYVALMIALSWMFSFSMLMPTLARSWGEFGLDSKTFSCTILRRDGGSPKKFLFILGFLVPCIVIIVSYSCIFYKVRQSRQNIEAHSPMSPTASSTLKRQNSQRNDEIRLTRMMLIIFCSFILCFLPLMIVNVFDSRVRYPTIHVLASVLAWMSSCINPFIYAMMNRHYRQAYYRLLCRKGHLRSLSTGSSITRSQNSTFGGASKTVVSEVFVFPNKVNSGKIDKDENAV
ncbi:protein trapped in endoderm-1-like [Limulus polyphemus]|uniref:Protein trapped in endoderm-1-like n=1 Tax=Limulus polyphemus TaxID=6850 RepID=A0ABM1STT9_LIMPO|nr:protein trapped in endoderm-1-like [Limulus polyphemus]XP_013779277.1 protein trapped in endoderm-1-like [Limulus polyphemus]XP_022247044.1 protein trapped in endoderm-1-like [Limulus polyphemus]XP_022247045.1 protein trapped in endoderm-1-like [Limulus polyphemus]XP_022247046.1 protein trapped in endoderm-1-like [Limulus polyphemus]XP_022247047.1 protein trapped in endoderm-1-like [Limulus polyphemus]XP_022247048.1 protein trapped in endoderm-1-like [Limulus polyphemus]XP_022247049.1 pro